MSDTESVCAPKPEEFKLAVKEWVMINDQIADMRKVIADHNKRKKQLTEYIILFMKENEKEIMREVGNLPDDVTVIIVTHSAEVVQKCSKIYSLSMNGLISI